MVQLTCLQNLAWPEPGLCTERDLFFHLDDGAALSQSDRQLAFTQGGQVRFGTYYNQFSIGKWVTRCALSDLRLQFHGEGRFEFVVFLAQPERSWERLTNEIVTISPDKAYEHAFDMESIDTGIGTLFVEMRCLSEEGYIDDLRWLTAQAPRRLPELMLSVTTFKREKAVARTAARFEAFASQSEIGDHLHMVVVDNGQSADFEETPHVSRIANENLGGSGGFARGLLAAQERGASHCLFMDDDAAVLTEAIARTWVFLAYTLTEDVAIAGSVANSQHRWKLWENGARFDHFCLPQNMGLDLRDPGQVMALEFASTPRQPDDFYGGWWYFAFPVAQVRHMPFPFFVRGDDVSFSLAHDFDILTLPGVLSFQDEDFSVKESPLTVYLDLRSHLAHHLSLPSKDSGVQGITRIILRFWMRSLLACHYETLAAIKLACEDILAGPEFFRANADMAKRRADIGQLTQEERWGPQDPKADRSNKIRFSPHRFGSRLLMKLTLNGHLLPGFGRIGNRINLPAAKRGERRPIWGAAQISYISADGERSYTVRHDKKKAWALSREILQLLWRIRKAYPELKAQWQRGYTELTSQDYWRDRLKLDRPD